MSARPWMPLYVNDFRLDTLDLDCAQVGVYMILLMLAWKRDDAALPNDMVWLGRSLKSCFAKFHGHEFNRIVPPLLDRYFELGLDDKWRNKRLTNERQKADKLSVKQKQNADIRWAGSNKNKDLPDTDAMPLQSQLQLQSKKEDISRATRSDDGFEEFWKAYPKRASASPKKPARLKYDAALKRGVPHETILAGARAYSAECDRLGKTGTEYVKTPAVWVVQEGWTAFTDRPSTGPPAGLTFEQRAAWAREQMAKERAENVEGPGNNQGRDLLERRPGLRAINN